MRVWWFVGEEHQQRRGFGYSFLSVVGTPPLTAHAAYQQRRAGDFFNLSVAVRDRLIFVDTGRPTEDLRQSEIIEL